jgi:hypothetical protein
MRVIKPTLAKLAKAEVSIGSGLSALSTRVKSMFTHVSSSEVAEALIATWCIEFLRVRRLGKFNVVEIMVISVLMLGVKTIITEAGRRRYSEQNRTIVMSNRTTQVDRMGVHRDATGSYKGYARRSNVRRRKPYGRDYYPDL